MAANVQYENQTDASGDRISTNGYYTGHHKGTVMQDALKDADNAPYYNERMTERQGTMTQDALPNSMPSIKTASSGGGSTDSGSGSVTPSGDGV